ncbi:MAG: 1-(5-phosphoribosyl)-5-[(5-phosphoribosylamino)methylideneamino]imidazole-4-carboxamide isomerase [Clostridiales Family XIII bacterium]|jgi:phosphoribosylformimino-5-aminoimidazole carboxamide ribotide isomerase|nr:1-(5-phosphoribosyl)-5-[(5-phosphoribosylamino)methylideneamino]imidazole-4-carboxamide isomerase [Clostridiales Family XIII bacterium]
MIIFPAIDLKDGRPVRLTKGDFATTEQVADDALETAKRFEAAGATHLHMVDLDGALTGHPVNDAIVQNVAQHTNLFIEIGGGIRNEDHIKTYLGSDAHAGGKVARVILGSVAIDQPDFTKEMIARYGERIAIGIDAMNGFARGGGWLEGSKVRFTDLACAMTEAGAKTIIFTDISKDGTLSGPNLEQLAELTEAAGAQGADIIASGGVATIDDIKALAGLGLGGAICGKSIYKGTLRLEDALSYQ